MTTSLRKEFGVAGEGDAGVGDDALLHRRGDQCLELSVQAAVGGARQHRDHVMRIAHIELPRDNGRGQRDVDAAQMTRHTRASARAIERFDLQRDATRLRAAQDQIDIADRDQVCGKFGCGKCRNEFRPDARRLTCGNRDPRQHCGRRHGHSLRSRTCIGALPEGSYRVVIPAKAGSHSAS
jgi:hypothetical protein